MIHPTDRTGSPRDAANPPARGRAAAPGPRFDAAYNHGRLGGHGVSTEGSRFLQLADVCEVLNISSAQAYALVRSGELPAIKIGGRGQWRVERSALEDFIAEAYTSTREFVESHPFGSGGTESD